MTNKPRQPKTVLYARVSTSDQTVEHQRTQAEKAGFVLTHVITDDGVSGVSTALKDRPQGKRLFDLLWEGDTLVVRWVDRLGRNYQDVSDNIREFIRKGVIIRTVINNMTFDGTTTDPMQMAVRDALIGFMAATAQAQAEVSKEMQRAGIAHAAQVPGKYRGRQPSYTREQLQSVIEMAGSGVSEIAKLTGLSRQTIYRIQADPVAASAALDAWNIKAAEEKEAAA